MRSPSDVGGREDRGQLKSRLSPKWPQQRESELLKCLGGWEARVGSGGDCDVWPREGRGGCGARPAAVGAETQGALARPQAQCFPRTIWCHSSRNHQTLPSLVFWKGARLWGERCRHFGGFTGLCVPFSDAKGLATPQSVSPGSTEITKEELPDSFHLAASSSEDLPTLWKAVSSSQSIRALGATDIQKWKVRAVSRWSKA